MNGLSFEEFENSSFDSLYSRNFAGAQDFDAAMKDFKGMEGRFALQMDNGRLANMLQSPGSFQSQALPASFQSQVPTAVPRTDTWNSVGGHATRLGRGNTYAGPTQRALPAPAPQSVPARGASFAASDRTQIPVPLNDMAIAMPGNSRVDHTWKPSREADNRARASDLAALPAARPAAQPATTAGGGNRGAFVNWSSN
eukprot:TRINITY_DN38369_c0_g1_i2.p1 TRINITY_DN38369_c0_g1~~TRINITY_DN38369_c0_g1_i2.p1  ORF type:complete len:198 (-),score=42.61 TRINITY_DN38369_c0_g1_i2:98-691(-)